MNSPNPDNVSTWDIKGKERLVYLMVYKTRFVQETPPLVYEI